MKRATISLFIKIISFQQNKNVIHNNESNKYISIFDIAQSSIYTKMTEWYTPLPSYIPDVQLLLDEEKEWVKKYK